MQLCPEFGIGMGLSADDGAHPGLGQTDDPPGNAVGPALEHETLLFVERSHQIHAVFLLFGQFYAALYELDDVAHIPPDVLQLLFDSRTNRFRAALFALGQPQKIPAGTPAVHPRLLLTGAFADLIHCFLQLFPDLVEQVHVLGIAILAGQQVPSSTSVPPLGGSLESSSSPTSSDCGMDASRIAAISSSLKRFRNATNVDAPKGHGP